MTRANFVPSILLLLACFYQIKAVRVTVEQGELEGQFLNAVVGGNTYYSFKGIPYAAPPLGSLRFKAPQPPQSWEGVRNASEHAPICIQFSIFTEVLSGEEDCLYLNVYTPNLNPETPLPVMFFIFGGGYFEGSGNIAEYGPDHLVRRDVVVVTFNHRLGALGFLSLDTEDVPGNAGLKDQVAALIWVQKNIANFGGDADQVTIFGESSGSTSVAYHLISPMSKGLFKRGILMSGVPSCDWVQGFLPRERSFILGKLLGNDTEDPNALLEFLQSVPAENIPTTNPRVIIAETLIYNPLKMVYFVPVVEKDFGQERFLVEDFDTTLKTQNAIDFDIMVGYNNEESVLAIPVMVNKTYIATYKMYPELYVPRKIIVDRSPEQVLEISEIIQARLFQNENNVTMREYVTYASQTFVTYDTQRFVKIAANNSVSKIFFYRFSCFTDRNIYGKSGVEFGIQGAAHKDELAYLFEPATANLTTSVNSTEFELIERVTTIFSNFAKYGHPTPDNSLGVTWPEYDCADEAYLEIGNELSIGQALEADMVAFWKYIYEYSGMESWLF